MQCLKCGKESKWEFCRQCKEKKHNASAMVSQNKKKLVKLLLGKWLNAQWFEKFLLYTENIKKYGQIYMEYEWIKEYRTLKLICGWINVVWLVVMVWSIASIVIVNR